MVLEFDCKVGDKVYILAGCVYRGEVLEVLEDGLWLTEDHDTEEFVSYLDITEWAVE